MIDDYDTIQTYLTYDWAKTILKDAIYYLDDH